ncbi:protoporphyrinogen oxidase [Thalassoroseus pseudoceratinae]|uniref:protoporphyrinogen oxidase n=1 Tax=Thalassoroseus pseudoceratinae TaxID=2713176 RepID=UPI00197F87AA|nr:protoporphyrinogen oxidase [Thalassoroseus pseudoceratinae]
MSGNERPRRIAVIGGGFSGLAAANRLGELRQEHDTPCEITLFDANDRFGGVLGTVNIGGYRVETGADSFITNKPWAVDLCKRLGIADRLISTDETYRRSLVLHRGRPVPVPDGFMLMTPAKVWPVLRSPLFSWTGKIRMGLETIVPRRRSSEGGDDDESLADFVRRRFGNEALERLVQPLVGGIYTSDPEKLSLRATLSRFLDMERDHRSLILASRKQQRNQPTERSSGARYGLFATPDEGISVLVNALAERVQELADCQLGKPVTSVRQREDSRWILGFSDADDVEFDAVVMALPAWRAAGLLDDTDSELAGLLSEIEYASTAIVVSGHRLADIQHPMDAFGMVVPAIEKRRILAVSMTSRKFPGRAPDGCIQLRTFVGGAMQPEELDATDEEITDVVQQELAEIFGVCGEPDFVHVARWNRAMPQYHLGHLERVRHIEDRVRNHRGLALAGNAFHGVGVPDVIHRGETSAETIWKTIVPPRADVARRDYNSV